MESSGKNSNIFFFKHFILTRCHILTTQKGRSIVYMTSAVVVFPMGKYTCILSSIVFTIGLIKYVNRCRDIGPRDDEPSLLL